MSFALVSRPSLAACARSFRPGRTLQVRWPRLSSASRSMDDSLSSWLSLREAADAGARSVTLTDAIARSLADRPQPLRLLDLATGTGSNIRYLAPRLPRPQEWLAIDRDPALLAEVKISTAGCRVDTRRLELGPL